MDNISWMWDYWDLDILKVCEVIVQNMCECTQLVGGHTSLVKTWHIIQPQVCLYVGSDHWGSAAPSSPLPLLILTTLPPLTLSPHSHRHHTPHTPSEDFLQIQWRRSAQGGTPSQCFHTTEIKAEDTGLMWLWHLHMPDTIALGQQEQFSCFLLRRCLYLRGTCAVGTAGKLPLATKLPQSAQVCMKPTTPSSAPWEATAGELGMTFTCLDTYMIWHYSFWCYV